MNKSIDQKKYGIQTDVAFDGDSIVFNPQETEFLSNIEKLEHDMLTIVSDITMIGNHSYFNQYT